MNTHVRERENHAPKTVRDAADALRRARHLGHLTYMAAGNQPMADRADLAAVNALTAGLGELIAKLEQAEAILDALIDQEREGGQ